MITSGRGTNIAPRWSPDGTRLVYQHTDPQNSADLFVVDAKAGRHADAPDRLDAAASIDKSRWSSRSWCTIPVPTASRCRPGSTCRRTSIERRKHPAIVWIHGDGVNQNYDGWHVQRNYAVYSSFHQYLLQQGYVVIAPDYRGSIGYGKAWRQGVYMDVGGKDAKDAWMAANYLKTLPYVDTDRVGVWGLSYGGFFTLIAMTDQPRLFRCGHRRRRRRRLRDVLRRPVSRRLDGQPDRHAGASIRRSTRKASPISNIERLERPLLVLHGTADVNVPYLHSVRLLDEALKQGKGPLVEFMTYPGEFHYFTRAHVLKDAWTRAEKFFKENLGT